ncbi:MarR family winged helix-turn-helix transcriptional regulator [Svornostia abyssi]|uniref:MarR family winged helix-turn-helix transcriptional regulator n=1 Tax=Svornostia abyssi TaxID=2898438 RepID=A0ABY5PMG2_9ACTN|nr:MarR family winged helix-turn-helix transcriptional regulator [Parviterribacteraceae bacterium J379]
MSIAAGRSAHHVTDLSRRRVWRTAARFRRLQVAARAAQLDPTEWSVLAYLSCQDEVTVSALSADLAVQTGSLANALSRLSSRELIEPIAADSDRRRRAYRLTEKGENLLDELTPAFENALDDPSQSTS